MDEITNVGDLIPHHHSIVDHLGPPVVYRTRLYLKRSDCLT
jgi:hypothetical protein